MLIVVKTKDKDWSFMSRCNYSIYCSNNSDIWCPLRMLFEVPLKCLVLGSCQISGFEVLLGVGFYGPVRSGEGYFSVWFCVLL